MERRVPGCRGNGDPHRDQQGGGSVDGKDCTSAEPIGQPGPSDGRSEQRRRHQDEFPGQSLDGRAKQTLDSGEGQSDPGDAGYPTEAVDHESSIAVLQAGPQFESGPTITETAPERWNMPAPSVVRSPTAITTVRVKSLARTR